MRLSSVLIPAGLACSLVLAVSVVEPQADYELRLGGARFDPLAGVPRLEPGWDATPGTGKALRLVQLRGATRDTAIEKLRDRGLEPVQYIHPYTYVVWGEPESLARIRDEPEVRWAGEFAPGYKVLPRWQRLSAEVEDVKVLLYRGADTDRAIADVEALGGTLGNRRVLNATFEHATFRIPGDRMLAVARIPGVYSAKVQPTDGGLRSEMSDQVIAGNVDGANLAFPGYQSWLAGLGLDGSGVTMANVDSGVNAAHPDLANRMVGCTGTTCSGADSSHGTHTAGIMAGDGSSGELDANGFLRGLGVAPGALLFEQQYSPTFTQAGGMLQLMKDSLQNGAVVSGNSWGPSGTPQGYDDDTMQTDIGVRDADPDTPGNQPLVYVLSFMNGYGGAQSQGSPDEAKNLFTIGSTKMRTSSGSQETDLRDLSSNTAHGPALDSRIIPHMVAPGCYVDSTNFGASDWTLKCGTSMASPHVAGAVALFVEYYRGLPGYVADPSPALVKAAFLATAVSLAGHEDADGGLLGQPFDAKQGWGRMDLAATIDPPPGSVRYFDQELLFDDSGESWTTTVSPHDPALPVRVMLVWTDAPGHGLGGATPAWNNDLDLIVERGGQTYRGNNFDGSGSSIAGGTADAKNNTEGVFLPAANGDLNLRVEATNINSDGVPGVGDGTDQDFALVCVNCADTPGFTLMADSTTREVCAPATASYAIQVGSVQGFTDPVTLSASPPAGATASFSVNPVTPGGASELELDPATAVAGDYVVTVDGDGSGIQRQLELTWKVRSAAPAAVSPTAPADGASGVLLTPTLSWDGAAQATSYVVEVAADPAFAQPVYAAVTDETSHTAETALTPGAGYFWRVTAINRCGVGAGSASRSFSTLAKPAILLVDDDDNSPDVRADYTDLLAALGRDHDVWDTANSDDEPGALDLAPYETVIWFTGDEFGGAAGPGTAGESALAGHLDASACLLVSSQDYFFDRDLTSFMQTYLGVGTVTGDTDHVTAAGAGSVFAGIGPYNLSYPYTNFSDTLSAGAGAEPAFDGSEGVAGVNLDAGVYRTTFLGFGVEAIAAPASRQEAVDTFLQWCDGLAAVDGDADGTANGGDCAPGDPAVWAPPSPAVDLIVDAGGALSWSAPFAPGGTAPLYDVIRGSTPYGAAIAGECVFSDLAVTSAVDATVPLTGGWFYLIRARNVCGSTLGENSAGGRPDVAVCP